MLLTARTLAVLAILVLGACVYAPSELRASGPKAQETFHGTPAALANCAAANFDELWVGLTRDIRADNRVQTPDAARATVIGARQTNTLWVVEFVTKGSDSEATYYLNSQLSDSTVGRLVAATKACEKPSS